MATDKNGLILSNQSDSGYKFVTTLFDGPLAGKFIAFADVVGDDRQHRNNQHGKRVAGFFGFKNVLALSVHDDVRDAAYVGQHFYGEDNASRNANVDTLFEGNESVVPTPIGKVWQHDPDYATMDKAKTRATGRVTLTVQDALAAFHKANRANCNAKASDAEDIRNTMTAYLKGFKKPKNSDVMEAAKLAFEPYMKGQSDV